MSTLNAIKILFFLLSAICTINRTYVLCILHISLILMLMYCRSRSGSCFALSEKWAHEIKGMQNANACFVMLSFLIPYYIIPLPSYTHAGGGGSY